jgi:CheY-like chemotaxis protein
MTSRRRLLVLDDEVDFGAFVAKVATDLGYEAVATSAAGEFKSRYLAARPDMIVLDVVMPQLDGIEIIRWLADVGCEARIIIVSGYNPAFAHAAQLVGEQKGGLKISQMQKPVKLADLRSRLAQGLEAGHT